MSSVATAARLVSLGKSAVRAIKKTLHKTRRSRPFTTVAEGCDRDTALALLSGAGGVLATDTARYLRVTLTGDEATAWLRIVTPVGPVKESFPVWVMQGQPRGKVHVVVDVESVEVLHDASKALLTLKIRTFVVERGISRQESEALAAVAAAARSQMQAQYAPAPAPAPPLVAQLPFGHPFGGAM